MIVNSAQKIQKLVITGMRADELMLRMKYAGFSEEEQIKCVDLQRAVEALVNGAGEVCYCLANYSAVFSLQGIIKNMEGGMTNGK